MTSFDGKVVWITGASSGLGEALAMELARVGARLVLTARRSDRLEAVRERCAASRAALLPLDLADAEAIPEAVRHAESLFGGIDVLVCNAGISQRATAQETDITVVRRIFEVNFFATVGLANGVLPAMKRRGGGQIVVVSSVVGRFGAPGRSAYSASKHALHGYFDSLRAEVWKEGIGVTLVLPGAVRTEIALHALMGDGSPQERRDPRLEAGADPKECARQIVRAVRSGRPEVTVGLDLQSRAALAAARLLPALLRRSLRSARL